jgi:ubiquinone/menaquinone biosynthesis C-methylase UbiE
MKNNHGLYADEMLNQWLKITEAPLLSEESYFLQKALQQKDTNVPILEGGTGGGRIAFNLEQMGYSNVTAFDFVEEMIDYAQKIAEQKKSNIHFLVQDALNLRDLKDNSYEAVIYLQQLVTIIPPAYWSDIFKEIHRVGKQDAIIIFSFLNYQARWYNVVLSFILQILRFLRNEKKHPRDLPWLLFDGKINWNCLNKNQSCNRWMYKEEVEQLLKKHGFNLIEVQISSDIADITKPTGCIYAICTIA